MPEPRKKPSSAKEEFEVAVRGGLRVKKGQAHGWCAPGHHAILYIQILSGI
jgi:hypothetical protein